MSEDARIKPSTVATVASSVRSSNHSTRFNPQMEKIIVIVKSHHSTQNKIVIILRKLLDFKKILQFGFRHVTFNDKVNKKPITRVCSNCLFKIFVYSSLEFLREGEKNTCDLEASVVGNCLLSCSSLHALHIQLIHINKFAIYFLQFFTYSVTCRN